MMKFYKTVPFLLVAASVFSLYGRERGIPIFSDSFQTRDTFAENWIVGKGYESRTASRDGSVHFTAGGSMTMRRPTPEEFYAEADFTIRPDTKWFAGKPIAERRSAFCGFRIENFSFFLLPQGNTWMIYQLPGQKKSHGKQTKIEGFKVGSPVHVAVSRSVANNSATYRFIVNGKDAGSFTTNAPAAVSDSGGTKQFSPLTLFSFGLYMEVDNFSLSGISKKDSSPNMIVNSSFEYDEDGIPPYYCRTGMYHFAKHREIPFENYLKAWKVDTREKHSGKQSLKLVLDGSSAGGFQLWTHGTGTVKGLPGVFSVWMKSDTEKLPVRIRYGHLTCDVAVGKEWKRYELMNPELPGTGHYSPVSLMIREDVRGTLWIDDLQAEVIPLPREKKETYATGYRPSDLDKAKFAKADQVKRAPGFRIPLLPPDAAPTVKLDSWKGKAVKLDQFYFKNEKPARNTEAFVACDEKQLYIGFRNYGESPEALALPREARDSFSAFGRDGLELFFNVSNEKDQYYHFVANSNGLQTDLFRDDAQWDSVWKSEAAVNSAAGSVDYLITIPFSSFAGPALNSRWLVNLCRNDVHDKSKKEYQCLFRNHVLGYRQQQFWPVAELPEKIIRKWSLGARNATVTEAGKNRVVYSFAMGNCTGNDRALVAQVLDRTNQNALLGERKFNLAAGESVLSVPAAVSSRKVRLILKDGGSIVSDQIFLPVRRSPLSVLGRLNYYMNEPEAEFKLTSSLDGIKNMTAVLECAGRQIKAKPGPVFRMRLPLKGIPDGVHALHVRLLNKDGSVAAAASSELVRKPYRKGATQINRFSRSLVHNGKPVFMIAPFFGDFGFAQVFTKNICLNMLDFACRNGFRTGHILIGPAKESVANGKAFLKAAAQKEFPVMLWTKYGHSSIATISDEDMMRELDSPNILSQMIMDEPELVISSGEARDYLRKMRPNFPYTPVHMNNTVIGIPNRYGNLETDILMLDNYLTAVENQTVEHIVKHADIMREIGAEDGKPCYYFLVCTNFPLHYKEPSCREQLAQSYGVIAAGCTGISYYIGFPTTEGSWRAMLQVNKEVLSMEEALLSEEDTVGAKCGSTPDKVRVLTKKHKGHLYLVSVNINRNPAGKTVFTLPSEYQYAEEAEVLFENRTIPVKNGQFSDDFPGHSRHVYKLKLKQRTP